MRLRGWQRFSQDVLQAYAESVFDLDSAAPPRPLFSDAFITKAVDALAALKGYSDHEAASRRWQALLTDARALTAQLLQTRTCPAQALHQATARFTALMHAVHHDYPGFALRSMLASRNRIRTRQSRVEHIREQMEHGSTFGGTITGGGALGAVVGGVIGFLGGQAGARLDGVSLSDMMQAFRGASASEGFLEERACLTLEHLDFDEDQAGFGAVTGADDDAVFFPCSACGKTLKIPHAKSALKGRCACGASGFDIPVANLRRILERRRQAFLQDQGKTTCARCGAETSASGAYVNPFSVAGYCSRRCFEIEGSKYSLPTSYRFRDDAFETSCGCGAAFAFTAQEFRSTRPCSACPVQVIIPDRADVEKAADKLCPVCGTAMLYAAKTCRACLKAGRA